MWNQLCIILFGFSMGMCMSSGFHPMSQAMAPSTVKKTEAEKTFYDTKDADSIPLSNINLLRLEDDLEKRGPGQNFLRFGKSDNPMAAAMNTLNLEEELTDEDKRAVRNFLRFGRDPHGNFLRFGKSRSPLEFGLGMEPEVIEDIEKKANPRNYLRFGKAADRNFIRFGRSIDSQLKDICNECNGNAETSSKPAFASDLDNTKYTSESEGTKRSKRAVSAFYEDSEFFPHTPLTWNSGQFAGLEPVTQTSLILGSNEDLANNAQKRAHSRSFLRYGRDPLDLHFLRFGKRMTSEEMKNYEDDFGDDFSRIPRTRTNKNFIRFG